MNNLLSVRSLLLGTVCFLLVTASVEAAIIVHSFGLEGVSGPQTIAPLNTEIGAKVSVEPDYRALTSSNVNFKFVRHVYSREDDICFYWFLADEDPTLLTDTERWSDVYWWVGNVIEDPCRFVDGAEDGSNNFVLLYDTTSDLLVGVLQYNLNDFNDINSPARLVAYAVDLNGLTFADGVAAIQAIPEPSTLAFTSMALLGGLFKLRRRSRA